MEKLLYCPTCGVSFVVTGRGANRRRYCSPPCFLEAQHRREVERKEYHRAKSARQRAERASWTPEQWEALRAQKRRAYRRVMTAAPDAERAKWRAYKLVYMYGITPADYDALVAKQQGRCAICSRAEKLHIDHDHETKRVRGLLCGTCNRGIGSLREDPATLRAAADYLERARFTK